MTRDQDSPPDTDPDESGAMHVPGAASASRARAKAGTQAHAVTTQVGGQVREMKSAVRKDDPRHWGALAACCLAIAATAIDPPVLQATSSGTQGALRTAPETAAALVGVIYLIQASIMVFAGAVGDRLGRKRIMQVGLAGATLFYVLAAFAPEPWIWAPMGIVAAFFQAVVIPLALANVMVTFGPRARPVAIGIFISVQLTAALSAPALATIMFSIGGWGLTYLPAILFSLAAMVAVRRRLPENMTTEEMRWRDLLALSLWAFGVLLVAYAVVASAGGWGPAHLPALIVGIFLMGLFLTLMARSRRARLHMPKVPFRVIAVTVLAAAALGLGQSGAIFQLSGFLQGVQGYSPVASGVALAPFVIATLVGSLATGVAMERRFRGRGFVEVEWVRKLIFAGLLLAGFSVLSFGLIEPETTYLPIGIALAGLGAGAAIANVPRTDLLFRAVRPSHRGSAAGLNGGAFILGEGLGNAMVTVMLSVTVGSAWVARLGETDVPTEAAEQLLDEIRTRIFVHTAHPYQEPSWMQVVNDVPFYGEIFTDAFAWAMVTIGLVLLGTAVLVRLVLRPIRLELDPADDRFTAQGWNDQRISS